jgi:hypothetical protein
MSEDEYITEKQLAQARWIRICDALRLALEEMNREHAAALSWRLEFELGLRSIFTINDSDYHPTSAADWMELLSLYADSYEDLICYFVPRLERAFAGCPRQWLDYVNETGRSCFDPVELSACIAIAKNEATPFSREHRDLNQLLHWCWECVFGQYPIPVVRELPRRGHPTLILDIIKAIDGIELNWKSIGLTPIINKDMAIRWDDHERWTAFIKLMEIKTGQISADSSIRIRSDGLWRLVNEK